LVMLGPCIVWALLDLKLADRQLLSNYVPPALLDSLPSLSTTRSWMNTQDGFQNPSNHCVLAEEWYADGWVLFDRLWY
jgi:hypothetical protein